MLAKIKSMPKPLAGYVFSRNQQMIVQATQFFEFLKGIAHFSMQGDKVHLPPVLFQPMAADDAASAVGKIALSAPVNGTVEIAGPQLFRLDELVRRRLGQLNDPREVITDPRARYAVRCSVSEH
jgi:uncharacterized protein YbjT (DUF2867 family)